MLFKFSHDVDRVGIDASPRIVSVVDAFRALMSEGPYRRIFSLDEARAEIEKGALTRFDPDVVKAFVETLDDLGARDDKHELVLEAVEKELQQERIERKKRLKILQEEPVKEEVK